MAGARVGLIRLVTTIWVTLLVSGCSTRRADPAAPVGRIEAVSGEITWTRASSAPQPATVGMAVTRDMVLRTGPGASVTVRFKNNYVWTLAGDRQRELAKLAVIDLPATGTSTPIGDDQTDAERDRTSAAGRHAESEAATTEATARAAATAATESAPTGTGSTATPEVPGPAEPGGAVKAMTADAERERGISSAAPKPASKKRPPRGGGADTADPNVRSACDPGDPLCGAGKGRGSGEAAGPPREVVRAALGELEPKIVECARGQGIDGTVSLALTIGDSGVVTGVKVQKPDAPAGFARCLDEALVGAKVMAPFSGSALRVVTKVVVP